MDVTSATFLDCTQTQWNAYLDIMLDLEITRPNPDADLVSVGMRTWIVNHMRDVTIELSLGNCVLHTCIWLLDNFIAKFNILNILPEVPISCLFITAKYILGGDNIPSYIKFCLLKDVPPMEIDRFDNLQDRLLNHINCDIMAPNVVMFSQLYSRYAITMEDTKSKNIALDKLAETISNKVEEYQWIILNDFQLNSLTPSLLAMAALMAARKSQGLMIWPSQYEHLSEFNMAEIQTISLKISHHEYNVQYFDC